MRNYLSVVNDRQTLTHQDYEDHHLQDLKTEKAEHVKTDSQNKLKKQKHTVKHRFTQDEAEWIKLDWIR